MKSFRPGNKKFKGVFNYIYSLTNHVYPTVEISGTQGQDEAIKVISNPFEAKIDYDAGKNDDFTSVDIDLGYYRVLPSHYQLSTMIGGTPPLNFSLFGSNNMSEGWIPIDPNRYDHYLCPYEMGSSKTQCSIRDIKLITPKNIIGPFRYIRFASYCTRWELGNSGRSHNLRIGGIEVYGNLYKTSADIFRQRTCYRKVSHFYLSFFSFVVLCAK